MNENDCPHCGQDLRLAPNAWEELLRLRELVEKQRARLVEAHRLIDGAGRIDTWGEEAQRWLTALDQPAEAGEEHDE